jgi:hypothetical protein
MFESFIAFIKPKKTLYHFNTKFRTGYKNAWINNIKDYTP